MKQSVSPAVALIVVVVILAVLGGIFFWRSRPNAEEASETSKRGEESGRMMNGTMGHLTNEEMTKRMRGGSR